MGWDGTLNAGLLGAPLCYANNDNISDSVTGQR